MRDATPVPRLRWPLRALPGILRAGRFPLDDRRFETTYRHPTHALHLYEYAGTIDMDGRRLPLLPGTLTLSVANGRTRYDLPASGHHWCIHFRPSRERGSSVSLPRYVVAPTQRSFVAGRMSEIAHLHNLPHEALAGTRASALLLELLLALPALTTPAGGRSQRTDGAMERLIGLLEDRFADPWTVPQLAETLGMSQDHMARCFRRQVGMTIPRYLLRQRIAHARELLLITDLPVNRIGARVGLPNAQHFNKQFRLLNGISPTALRARPRWPAVKRKLEARNPKSETNPNTE